MPKARKRRGRRSLQPVKFAAQLALSTLGSATIIATPTVDNLKQDFDIVSTDLVCMIRDLTPGEGPLLFGLAEESYTVGELGEALDASPLSQYGTAQERAGRKVRTYGAFEGVDAEETVNDGRAIRRKMFLRAIGGASSAMAQVWIRNLSGATLTTGAILEIQGTHWGRWK